MFSYYGSKSKIANYYPPPKYKKIIEPFAGSARYSLKYWDNEVLLIEKNEMIYKIWKYLQLASEKDILSLPETYTGLDLRTLNISKEEMMLIYMCSTGGGGGSGLGYKITAKYDSGFNSWNKDKKRISKELFKIRHWKIENKDYNDTENNEQTWFIDPPYQFGGHKYTLSNKLLNFNQLSEWCMSRNGQVIVCENTKADWLPFKPMTEMRGIKFKTTEAIWSNHKTNYDNIQQTLF